MDFVSPDLSVFDKLKTKEDYDAIFAARKQELLKNQVANQSASNVYATQLLSGAAATGDQNQWLATLRHLNDNGVDVSNWATDVNKGAQQAQAARLAQSPLGSLLNAGLKSQSNEIALAGLTGTIPDAASSPMGGLGIMPSAAPAAQPVPPKTGNIRNVPTAQLLDLGTSGGANGLFASALEGAAPPKQPQPNGSLPATSIPSPSSVPPFVPPVRDPSQTQNAYQQAFQQAKDAYEQRPDVIAGKAAAVKVGEEGAADITGGRGTQDVISIYNKLKQDAKSAPGGVAQNLIADISDAANRPNDKAVAKGTYDADINNLYLAMIRSLKGTGRVMKAELDEIKKAQPTALNSTPVKMAKIESHMEYYKNRMRGLGFDPETGNPLGNNQMAPLPQAAAPQQTQYKPGMTKTSPTGTYLFNGGDPTQQSNWKKVK